MQRKKKIGMIIGCAHSERQIKIIRSIYNTLKDEDVDVHFFLGTENNPGFFVGHDSNFDYQYLTLYDYSLYDQLDCMIIASGSITVYQEVEDHLGWLSIFSAVPTIVIEDKIAPEGGVSMLVDNYEGMSNIVNHLIEDHGLKKITYLSGPANLNEDAKERLDAYKKVMADHGLPVTEDMIQYGDFSEFVEDKVEALFDAHPDLEAIVCANDHMAMASYHVARRHGRAIGIDIAITGFDNLSPARIMHPPLTTVEQRTAYIGRTAAEMALNVIAGKPLPTEPLRMPVRFIKRASCGCAFRPEDEVIDPDEEISPKEVRLFSERAMRIPLVTRGFTQIVDRPDDFFRTALNEFHFQGAKNAFIYLLNEPVDYRKGDIWDLPLTLYLAASLQDGEIFVEDPEDPDIIFPEDGLVQMHEKSDESHQFFSFLLYEGTINYGFLSVEIQPKDITFFYMISLQFGSVLRFMELSNQLIRQNKRLTKSANFDHLTDILNRRGIEEMIPTYIADHEGMVAIIIAADLDHLKQINDNFGHKEGDFAISATATNLRKTFGNDAVFGRIGGDEFLGIVVAKTGEPNKEIDSLKDHLVSHLTRFNESTDKPYYVEVSVGMCSFSCSKDTMIEPLIQIADGNLYEAKKYRRDSVLR